MLIYKAISVPTSFVYTGYLSTAEIQKNSGLSPFSCGKTTISIRRLALFLYLAKVALVLSAKIFAFYLQKYLRLPFYAVLFQLMLERLPLHLERRRGSGDVAAFRHHHIADNFFLQFRQIRVQRPFSVPVF